MKLQNATTALAPSFRFIVSELAQKVPAWANAHGVGDITKPFRIVTLPADTKQCVREVRSSGRCTGHNCTLHWAANRQSGIVDSFVESWVSYFLLANGWIARAFNHKETRDFLKAVDITRGHATYSAPLIFTPPPAGKGLGQQPKRRTRLPKVRAPGSKPRIHRQRIPAFRVYGEV